MLNKKYILNVYSVVICVYSVVVSDFIKNTKKPIWFFGVLILILETIINYLLIPMSSNDIRLSSSSVYISSRSILRFTLSSSNS